MVNCKQSINQLSEYLDKTLTPESREAVRTHFRRCPACVAFIDTYRKTTSLCRKVLRYEAPAGLAERVTKACIQESGSK